MKTIDVVCLAKEGSLSYETDAFACGELIITEESTPQGFTLDDPYPNPFNSMSRISFYIVVPCRVQLDLYDVTGRLVRNLTSGPASAGHHSVMLGAEDLSNGVYILRLKTGVGDRMKKIVLVR